MNKRGQVAVEYIMIVAISLFIILPGIYFFRNFAFESNDRVLQSRVADISGQLLSLGKEMYYYGPPSKSVKILEMPDQVNRMYVLTSADNTEYYLVFEILTTSGPESVLFEADYPIEPLETAAACDVACQGICDCFPERYYSRGPKNFAVEASSSCDTADLCVLIGEVSPELG